MTDNTKQLEITKLPDNRTQIVFKKAILKGKVSSSDVMNTILIAARMQAEMYINKLSRGAPLDIAEVKALKELSEITKINIVQEVQVLPQQDNNALDQVKANLYKALTDKLGKG